MIKKAILLAGGNGSRLYPSTIGISKQLLPVYDKPLIYYPLSILLLAGIKEIMIIVTPENKDFFLKYLGDGSQWGVEISYGIQQSPRGIADAILIGERFLGDEPFCLMLGDNIFYGDLMFLYTALEKFSTCTLFAYTVNDPERFGVVKFDKWGKATQIVEKPKEKISNWAIPGLYLFDHTAIQKTKSLEPSGRGELEITDLHKLYLEEGSLDVEKMNRGLVWFDTGTPESMLEASNFLHTVEKTQSVKVACLEEIALRKGLIDKQKLQDLIESMPNSDYRNYCKTFLEETQ